ncbi:PH domain-containing protein [Rhodopirellula sp. JC639]|uniref:PH domain-containing protein n=1 Tax=Stieleria mannarensis TaxID=2755585 RepID=UPI0015FEF425|nr:PH domain-containing protein [Rhodopirellula sp. JC639]
MSDISRMICKKCGKGIKFPTEKTGAFAKCPNCKTAQKLIGASVAKSELLPPEARKPPVSSPTTTHNPEGRAGSKIPPLPPKPHVLPAVTTPTAEATTVANVPPTPAVDSKLARFVSEGQPIKTVGKLLTRVEKICTNSETPEYIAVQHLPSLASPDAIVLTDRRVIIFRSKTLGRVNMVDVPWLDVSDIHISEGIVGATIHVTGNNGHTEKIDHLPKEQARSVYRVGQEREEIMREYRRTRKMEEDRNAAGGVIVNNAVAAPTPAAPSNDLTARLTQLKAMFDADLISQEEFDVKKADILSSL